MKWNTPGRKTIPGVMTYLLLLVISSQLAAQGELTGNWQTGEDNSVVEVTESNGIAVGKLVSSDNPKAIMGTEILRNVTQSNGVWKGKIWAAKRQKLMDATITPSADTLQIKVSAGMISRNVTWMRVNNQ